MRTKVETNLSVIWRLIVRIALVLALAYIIWRVRSVFVTVILAAMLAYVLLPVVDFLCRRRFLPFGKRWNRLIATVLVFVVFLAIVGLAVRLMFTPFQTEANHILVKFTDYYEQGQKTYNNAMKWYRGNIPKDLQQFLGKQDTGSVTSDAAGFIAGILKSTLGWFRNIVELVLIPVLAFYFVLDSRRLKREFIGLVPPWRVREALKIMRETSGILQSYVIGQLILCLIAGIVTYIVLRALGMNYALILALLAGVTRAIPILGPLISGIPICIYGALQSLTLGLWLLLFVVVMHFVESKFIMPILIGDRMKLHPAVILIALLIGAEFFGLLGMFLAAPVAALLRELLNSYIIIPRRKKALVTASAKHVSHGLAGSERI